MAGCCIATHGGDSMTRTQTEHQWTMSSLDHSMTVAFRDSQGAFVGSSPTG
jgi:hypothetical protein